MKEEYDILADIRRHHMETSKYGYRYESVDIDDLGEDDAKEIDEITPETKEDRLFESFAKEAMRELDAQGLAEFVLLRNDKLRTWWQKILKEELAERIRKEKIAHKKALREQGLAKLSDEEKEALGLSRKKK